MPENYQIHGFVVEDNDLRHFVATYLPTNELYVMTVEVTYSSSASSNLDYKFVVSQQKKIPKTMVLQPELLVKSIDSDSLPGSSTKGKRILLAGTSVSSPPHIFFAIYNTLYNVTEFLWEQSDNDTHREIVKAVEIDKNNNQGIIIST